MTPEQYNPADYLPPGYYPWPNDLNTHIEQMGRDQALWIDTDYTYLSEKSREMYKRMKLHHCMGRMVPYANYERVTPCQRFLLFHTVFDDQLEFSTREEVSQYRERLVAIFKGAQPAPEENGLFRQAAIIRDEFLAFMPEVWMERFIEEFHRITRYGAEDEMRYKNSGTVPSLAYFKILREYCVIFHTYHYMIDAEFDFVMPKDIDEHPVIQRMRALGARLIAWQNDFHSLPKELRLASESLNIIFVLQRKCNLSFKDALTEALRVHDEDVAELDALRADLPDFGVYQNQVERFALGLGTMIQGVNSFYYITSRYFVDGFPWPEPNVSASHL